jgi:hypothetical protein
VTDPRSGITRVVVVGAPAPLLAAVAVAAAECGAGAAESRPGTLERRRVTLRRPERPDGPGPSGVGG